MRASFAMELTLRVRATPTDTDRVAAMSLLSMLWDERALTPSAGHHRLMIPSAASELPSRDSDEIENRRLRLMMASAS